MADVIAEMVCVAQDDIFRFGGQLERDAVLTVSIERLKTHFSIRLTDRMIVGECGGVFDSS